MLRNWLALGCALALLCPTVRAQAQTVEAVSFRKIVDLGCHNVDGTCFVVMDGGPFGGNLGCPVGVSNEFRFDNSDTTIGNRTYGSLLAAFLAAKNVSVVLSGCTKQGYPQLQYFHFGG